MPTIEQLMSEYRRLARKLVYAGFDGRSCGEDGARFEWLRGEVLRCSSVGAEPFGSGPEEPPA